MQTVVRKKCTKVFALADEGKFIEGEGNVTEIPNAIYDHLDKILSLSYIDVELIKSKKFTVVLDTVCGAGGPILVELLKNRYFSPFQDI